MKYGLISLYAQKYKLWLINFKNTSIGQIRLEYLSKSRYEIDI